MRRSVAVALLLALLLTSIALAISTQGQQVVQRIYLGTDASGSYLEDDDYGVAVYTSGDVVAYIWPEAWEDLRVPLVTTLPAAAAPAFDAFLGNTKTYKFSAGEYVHFAAQMPHNWKIGSLIEFHVHWAPEDGNAGNVSFELEYTLQAGDGSAFPATDTISATDATGEVANAHQYTDLGTIATTGLEVSTMIIGRFGRIAAGDTYGSEVFVFEVDFHYLVNSTGSREEEAK